MPRGIPVATVAIGNAQNAGLLAVQIIASHTPELLEEISNYRRDLAQMVLDKQQQLDKLGYQKYLTQM
jgi:5-(carboxyamino)imidazole ribonucleotide mutase